MQSQAAGDDEMEIPFMDKSTDIAEVYNLRREIEAVFEPWYNSEIKPPWSDEEILVMCVCIKPNRNRRGIAEWLFTHFKWFRRGSRSLVSWVAGFGAVLFDNNSLAQDNGVDLFISGGPITLTNVRAVRMLLHNKL
jgi:hypothetical protein